MMATLRWPLGGNAAPRSDNPRPPRTQRVSARAAAQPAFTESANPRDGGQSRRWPGRTAWAALAALMVLLALVAGAWWLLHAPWWALRGIQWAGDLQHSRPATLQAQVTPRLQGNFLTLDLQATQALLQTMPWIRRAVVQKVWPGTLRVTLEEHRPAARWLDEDGAERLVNVQGELFDANLGEIDSEALPQLSGPSERAAEVLNLHQELQQRFGAASLRLRALSVSRLGHWRATLDEDVTVEIGRGTPDEVLQRTQHFISSLPQVTAHFRAPLESADLRHADGYALRLRGLTTVDSAASAGER
jgi:cell division protein FtsQ